MLTPLGRALVLFGLTVVLASGCSQETPLPDNTGIEPVLSPDNEDKSQALNLQLGAEFEAKVNILEDQELRIACIREYAQKFHEHALAFPATEAAVDSWCAVLFLGDDAQKEQAMHELLTSATARPHAEKSVEWLRNIIQNGHGQKRTEAITCLQSMTRLLEYPVVRRKRLGVLATSKSLPPGMREEAMRSLTSDISGHEQMGEVIESLRTEQSAFNERWLQEIARTSTGETQAQAVVSLAKFINRRNSVREWYADAPAWRFEKMEDEYLKYIREKADPDEAIQLENLLESLQTADRNLLESGRRELFAIQNLSVGSTAPDIVGPDLDGVEFKLSDYRGKIVLLDFWGDW